MTSTTGQNDTELAKTALSEAASHLSKAQPMADLNLAHFNAKEAEAELKEAATHLEEAREDIQCDLDHLQERIDAIEEAEEYILQALGSIDEATIEGDDEYTVEDMNGDLDAAQSDVESALGEL